VDSAVTPALSQREREPICGRPRYLASATRAALILLALPIAGLSGLATARADVDESVKKAEAERIAAIAKAAPAFVAIYANNGQGGGSGVVISPDGYALTNFHVTHEAGIGMKCGMPDGKLYDAVVVGVDPTGDLSLIKLLEREDFPAAELGDSDQVHAGDWCFAAGNPFLLATDFHPSISYGVVSGVHRYQYPAGTLLEYSDCLQVDAAINPGNSGGPLFNAQGQLIGINGRASFEKRGRVNVGVGYAISVNQAKNFIGCLKSGRIVDHATLGATVSTSDDGRVLVSDILEDSDAYRRGLREDDEIVSFAGRPIPSTNAFKNILGIFPQGWRIALSYRRDGKTYDILVRLPGVHHETELIAAAASEEPVEPNPKGRQRGAPKDDKEPPKDDKEKPKNDGEKPKDNEGKGNDDKKDADKSPPGDKPENKDQPDKPIPLPEALRQLLQKPPLAEAVKQRYEARSGFANYYFNKLARERIWKANVARGDFSSLAGEWALSGDLIGGGTFEIKLTDKDASIALPLGDTKLEVCDDLGAVLNPPGSGGLLAALHLWRKLQIGGPVKYGQLVYLGTMPLVGHDRPVEVIVGTAGGVDCHFMFDTVDESLVALEMYPAFDTDPCEVYFSDYRESEGRFFPRRLEVHYGDNLFAIMTITKADLKKESEK
jgi:S1-C subfamily serine protease